MYTFRKWVFTNVAIGELIAVAVLGLISLFLAVSVYYDIRFYISYHRALTSYSSGRLDLAQNQIESALSFRRDFAPARELQAKILVDSVSLDVKSGQALAQAEEVLKNSVDRRARPTSSTHLTRAAIHLKRYDLSVAGRSPDPAELKLAVEEVEAATGIDSNNVDALIVQAHLGMRRGDFATAERMIAQVDKQIREASRDSELPSIDALVDYYMARTVLAYRKKDAAAARDEALRVLVLRPEWEVPLANVAFLEAWRLIEVKIPRDDLLAREMVYQDMIQRLTNAFERDPVGNKFAMDAAFSLSQSYGLALLNLGDEGSSTHHLRVAQNFDPRRPTTWINMIVAYSNLANRPEAPASEAQRLRDFSRMMYAELARLDPPLKIKVLCLNNIGVVHLLSGMKADGLESLKRGLDLAEQNNLPCPIIHRNLAVYYAEATDWEAAKLHATKSLAQNPDQADFRAWRESWK